MEDTCKDFFFKTTYTFLIKKKKKKTEYVCNMYAEASP